MTRQTQSIECSYRRPTSGGPDGETAMCGLLQELTNVADADLCGVRADACRSCCDWFRPSPRHLNPVVASLLYSLSSRILDRGGVPGCAVEHAAHLHQRAAEEIPSEEDYVPISEETQGLSDSDACALEAIVPPPKRRSGSRVTEWAVGITTAPREQPTLQACLDSLAVAGWPEPRLFVDGDTALPEAARGLSITHRVPQIGAWPNYYLALGELLMRVPHADAFMLVQDDVVFFQHPQLRSYLERILWPGSRPGLVSLFCSRAYTHARAGWHELKEALVWGGQALIFSRAAATAFLADARVVHHRMSPDGSGLANIDWLVGEWASRTEMPVHLPTPSLVQHIGHVSALWSQVRAFGNRRASSFAGTAAGGKAQKGESHSSAES